MNYNQYSPWNEIVTLAVKQKGKPAVYIDNHLTYDEDETCLWRLVCEKFEDNVDMLSNLIHGGLFFFEDENEALEFFNFFNTGALYASGIYAELYDESGNCLTENT